ncbi:hypothetical protein VKT23_003161 [Stygiomarasmius scandens]|uniref:Exocyst complex component Sec8 n=1 Tax=Marasmiellus scandens TaxID=2682957 RepID=A0ABR1JWD2_9AGAR
MTKARELDATEISQQRDDRDYEAMCWVMDRLQEDSEFEPFVEFIPEVVAGFDYSAKLLIHRLLNHGHDAQTQNRDNNLQRLDYRISSLLQSCMVVQSPKYNRSNDHRQLHPIQDKEIIYRRTETCLKAIWSLTMMSPLPISGQAPTVYLSRKEIRFDERTLNLIHILRRDIVQDMDLNGLTISTCTSVTRSLLDMFIDQSWVLENEIAEFVRRGRFSDERIQIAMAQKDFTRNQSVQQLLQQLERISYELEVVILETGSKRLLGSITPNAGIEEMSVTDSNFLHQMDGLLICLDRFVTAIVLGAHDENSDQSIDGTRLELTKEATAHIRKFRGIVYHSGVLLTMEFVKCVVERLKGNGGGSMQSRDERVLEMSENSNVDSLDLPLPYESLNTIRRLYLKLFQDSEHLHPTGPLDLPAADPTGPSTSLDSPVTATPALDTLAPLSSPFRIYPEIRTLLLIYLEDALDPVYQRGGKIQEGMANVLLGLLGMVVDSEDSAYQVDDPGEKDQKKVQHNSNINKARKVTQRYTEEFPASETATRLLAKFDGI